MDPNVDYLSGETWTSGEMPEIMRWLRRNAPVYWSEKNQLWVLSKFEDISHVSKNPEIFCSGQGVRPGLTIKQGLIDEDDPKHTRLRKLINKGFNFVVLFSGILSLSWL